MSGQKIIDGIKNAIAGNFVRVTIDGQTWVRRDEPTVPLTERQLQRVISEHRAEIERLRTERDQAIANFEALALEVERLRIIAADYQALQHRANAIDDQNEQLRAALGPLLDAHWPLVESTDHEDENCRRARRALEQETR